MNFNIPTVTLPYQDWFRYVTAMALKLNPILYRYWAAGDGVGQSTCWWEPDKSILVRRRECDTDPVGNYNSRIGYTYWAAALLMWTVEESLTPLHSSIRSKHHNNQSLALLTYLVLSVLRFYKPIVLHAGYWHHNVVCLSVCDAVHCG